MNSVHTYSFIKLTEGYFDEMLLITNTIHPGYEGRAVTAEFSLRNPLNLLKTIPAIRKTIRSFEPDIIHIHQANTAAWITLLAAGNQKNRCIVTAWGSDILRNPQRGFLYRRMAEQIMRRAGYFTADARFVAEKMQELSGNKTTVSVINFGMDPVCKDASDLERCLAMKENIIYSNRLHKKLYRIDQIIHAFAAFVKKGHPSWKLVIAATGEETSFLKELAVSLEINDHVEFAGWLQPDENRAWYRRGRIFVSYPESDATSVSLLESMSAGCIPVLSDLPANREWVTDRKNGIISAHLTAGDFEQAMQLFNGETLYANLQTMLQQATKAQSRKLFFDLYDCVIANV